MGLFKNLMKKAVGKEIEFNVAGVTFKNGRKTRQAILRAMKYKDEPFNDKTEITLKREDFEGSIAIAVYANDQMIGYVPKDLKDEVNEAWKTEYIVESYEVLGSGKEQPFGCRIKILFKK